MDKNRLKEPVQQAIKSARSLLEEGKPGLARELLEKSLLENSEEPALLYELAGVLENQLLEYNEALHLYQRILDLDPTSIRAWISRGLILYLLCNDSGSIHAFQKAIEIDPDFSASPWLYLARLLKDPGEALRHLQKAQSLMGERVITGTLHGELLLQTGDLAGALKEFEIHYQKTSSPWDAFHCATILARQGNQGEAMEFLEKARALESISPAYHELVARLLANRGDLEGARSQCEKALEIRPDHLPAIETLARILFDQKETTRAYEVLRSVEKPGSAESLDLMARLLFLLDKKDELSDFLKANRLEKLDPVILNHLAESAYLGEDFGDALEIYQNLLKIHPDEPLLHFHTGLCLDRMERYELSIEAYRRTLELNPGYGAAWLNYGYALYRLERVLEALDATGKAIEIKPDFAGAWYNQACYHSLLGNRADSLEHLFRAIELKPLYKTRARSDRDFAPLQGDGDFLKITE